MDLSEFEAVESYMVEPCLLKKGCYLENLHMWHWRDGSVKCAHYSLREPSSVPSIHVAARSCLQLVAVAPVPRDQMPSSDQVTYTHPGMLTYTQKHSCT